MKEGSKELINKTRIKLIPSNWKAKMLGIGLIFFIILIIVLPFIRVEDVKVYDHLSVIVGYYIFVSLLFVIIIVVFMFIRGYIE